tara:strand:- start:109 stop:705 length:597 start_codon:yes stop_codon:yes gene_type:complete
MSKRDKVASLLSGFLIATLLLAVAANIGITFPYLWTIVFIFPVLTFTGIYIASTIGKKIPVIFQLSKFLLIGLLNTLVDLGILNLLIFTSGITAGVWFPVFKGLSFLGAVFNSYYWNRAWTFKAKSLLDTDAEQLAKFLIVSGIGLTINIAIASIIVNVIGPQFGISEKLWANGAALTAAAIVFTWNFMGYKLVVFKK